MSSDVEAMRGLAGDSQGWNPAAGLRCISCGYEMDIGPRYCGCPICAEDGYGAPLEVVYLQERIPPSKRSDALLWLAGKRQPIVPEARVRIGRPETTPLVPLASLGSLLFAKNETLNPTWGHKDRFHEVAVGAARLIGSRGIVASSTGNHGASAAAHASVAGLPSVIFCHPRASSTALSMIASYGGVSVQIEASEAHQTLIELVEEGWFPATNMDPLISGRSNPFGAEGYKSIAYEIAAQLGQSPGTVIVPTASGDTFYGIAKGFAEVSAAIDEVPARVVAAQPSGADPLVRSVAEGRPTRVPNPQSIALSVADSVTGRQALEALGRWGGSTVAVDEFESVAAVRNLACEGLLVEPASAVALAAYRSLRSSGHLESDRPTVLILTGAGVKWPSALSTIFPERPLTSRSELEKILVATRALPQGR